MRAVNDSYLSETPQLHTVDSNSVTAGLRGGTQRTFLTTSCEVAEPHGLGRGGRMLV